MEKSNKRSDLCVPKNLPPCERSVKWLYKWVERYTICAWTFEIEIAFKLYHLRIYPNCRIEELKQGFYIDDLQKIRNVFFKDAPALYVLPREINVVDPGETSNTHHLWSYTGILQDALRLSDLQSQAIISAFGNVPYFKFQDLMKQKNESFGKGTAAVILLQDMNQKEYAIQEWGGYIPNLRELYTH
jgi:hypothetical protein